MRINLLKGVYGYGFEKPSPLQQRCLLPLINGRDVLVKAQSGVGKTAAYIISSLQNIDLGLNEVQVLVLSPVRELSQDITNVFRLIGMHIPDLRVEFNIGGTRILEDRRKFNEGIHIVVGTPGRILDMIKKGFLKFDYLKTLIIDEGDEILARGFVDVINEIFSYVPPDCSKSIFSDIITEEILTIARIYMTDPVKILLKSSNLTLDGIKQYYVSTKLEEKVDSLLELLRGLDFSQISIYCNKKENVEFLNEVLSNKGWSVTFIHGELFGLDRKRRLKNIRVGSVRILIITDLVDIQPFPLVINYDLPIRKELYINRIGRTGPYGRKGTAINFITPEENDALQEIQRYYNTDIEELPSNISKISH